ncbi:hypothetical protein B5S32_g280 [[Candida] boidinii]|nr:hypothetical protein B5S32_g280 [[Candida] boidinii]
MKPILLPVQFIDDKDHVKSEFALVDTGATANFISQALVDRFKLKTIQGETITMKTANSGKMRSNQIIKTKLRVNFHTGPQDLEFTAYVAPGLHYNVYLGMPVISKYARNIEFDSSNGDIVSLEALTTTHVKDDMGLILIIPQKGNESDVRLETIDIEKKLADSDQKTSELIDKFGDVITQKDFQEVPPNKDVKHKIILFENTDPVWRNQYRLGRKEQEELQIQIADLLEKEFIEASTSPFNSPVLFVKKKDGTYRLCIDYRALNNKTIKNKFPLPFIEDILDRVSRAKIFSKLDLMSGYHQVQIAEADRYKTAFSTLHGHYEWVVMPFGLTNAPATFQYLMNKVLGEFINEFVTVYLDDILIYSDTIEQHEDHVVQVLQKLREHKLVAKQSKCEFFYSQIRFLGYVIGESGIQTDPDKIEAVKNWTIPKTPKEAMSFIGLTGFYRRFIKSYARLASPIFDYMNKKCTWEEEQTKSFETLKQSLITAPVMVAPIFEKDYKFRLSTDASDEYIGFILEQLNPYGKLLGVIRYGSMRLNSAQMNYPIREKEFLAVIMGLKKYRTYLIDRPFKIRTDHHSLTYIKQQDLRMNDRVSRWIDQLTPFDFEIDYIKGEANSAADALSRPNEDMKQSIPVMPNMAELMQLYAIGDEDVSLSETYIEPPESEMTLVNFHPSEELKNKITEGYEECKEFQKYVDVLKNNKEVPKTMRNSVKHYRYIDDILYFNNDDTNYQRVCVPGNTPLREAVIRQTHDTLTGGHRGKASTIDTIRKNFYWPNMDRDIADYIKRCQVCQRTKQQTTPTAGLFLPLPIPKGRWTDITMDFVGPFPATSRGYDTIMVVVDRATKRAHFIPTKKQLSSADTAQLYLDNVFKHHGIPNNIISDRDTRFTAAFWQTLHGRFGTSLFFSTTNHPQTDGQSERTIRTLQQLIRAFCLRDILNWDLYTYGLEFSYNSTVHSTIKMEPFKADYGFVPNSPGFYSGMSVDRFSASSNLVVSRLKTIFAQIRDHLTRMNAKVEERLNKSRTELLLNKGDLMLIRRNALHNEAKSRYKKIAPVYFGPYKVVEKVNDNAYEMDVGTTERKDRVINIQYMKRFTPSDSYPKVPPITDGEIKFRMNEVSGIAGIDPEQKTITVFWQDCMPGHGSTIPLKFLRSFGRMIKIVTCLDQFYRDFNF